MFVPVHSHCAWHAIAKALDEPLIWINVSESFFPCDNAA